MTLSFKRIGAILIKEAHDFKTNINILIMYLIPILLAYIYDNFIPGMPRGFALSFGILFLVVMVGMYVPSMMIAEEKEKKTLEVLLLSPANSVEVFIGKGLLTFISIIVSFIILIAMFGGVDPDQMAVILVGGILTAVFCIQVGIIVGLLSKNQMATGVVGTPVYMALLLVPMLGSMGSPTLEKIAKVFPTYYYNDMLYRALNEFEGNHTLLDMIPELGILLGSIAVAFVLLLLVYRRRGLG
ncbi:MAG: ABC transporter permease [Caldicoprobacterales bacterium]|jgi:ABC-2 type transport system permease protein|nr:ABC transporter permease [Clostridiales bacterium]